VLLREPNRSFKSKKKKLFDANIFLFIIFILDISIVTVVNMEILSSSSTVASHAAITFIYYPTPISRRLARLAGTHRKEKNRRYSPVGCAETLILLSTYNFFKAI
jgi:hypothetical protein